MIRKRIDPPLRLTAETKPKLRAAFSKLSVIAEYKDVPFFLDMEVDWIIKLAELELERSEISKFGGDTESRRAVDRALTLARKLDAALRELPLGGWSILKSEVGSVELPTLGSRLLVRSRLGPLHLKRGRPTSKSTPSASFIADKAADAYTRVTGKPATSGERSSFPQFLSDLFDALSIRDSAEVHAKARRAREQNRNK
jgi:hypothetical protein